MTRCDSRANFGTCPCCGYSAAWKHFGACPYHGYNAAAGEPFRRLPLPRVQRESSRLLYTLYVKVLLSALGGMQEWSEKRLLDYHTATRRASVALLRKAWRSCCPWCAGDAVAVAHKLFEKMHCQELLQQATSA